MLLIIMYVQNLVKIHLFVLKILSGNASFKGHNCIDLTKLRLNNPKLHVVNINAYVKFGQNPFFHSQGMTKMDA